MVDFFPGDTGGQPLSVYHSNLISVSNEARQAAFSASPSLANSLVSAANQLDLLIGDRYENPDCSVVNLPGQPVECYSNSCLLWGRPDAGLVDESLFTQFCDEWQANVNNWTQEIANLLTQAEEPTAEFAQAVADTGANVYLENQEVWPDAGDIFSISFDAVPGWIKFGAFAVAVLFVADKLR
jgi:hypothetical protein